ncbi:MAG: hypothetical protein ACHQCF_04185 [Solirubrobacterales bacterium]
MRGSRTGTVRIAVIIGALALAGLASMPASALAGTTYFAAPKGSGAECTVSAPCALEKAVELAVDGDSVTLSGGTYQLKKFSGVWINNEITFGATPGAPALIETTLTATIAVSPTANAHLHDLRYIGESPLILESGSAERVFVEYFGQHVPLAPIAACELNLGTSLRDSVCLAREGGQSTEAEGIELVRSEDGLRGTAFLRNDVAFADDAGGSGLYVQAGYGARFSLDASGVIAHSLHGKDVTGALVGSDAPEAHVQLTHSNYLTVGQELPFAEVTPPGTNGNQTAAPLFVNAAAGDFHEVAGSPTIDGGLADSQTGSLDLDGHVRAQPGCLGAASVPDIGAYEISPTAPCPPPPKEPLPPEEPPKPVFRIVKVTVHGAGGTIQVETPGPGTLTLTGLGVKLVTRPSPQAGVVSMPLRPWAITQVRLNSVGKARVHLKVTFDPISGVTHERARSVLLKKG